MSTARTFPLDVASDEGTNEACAANALRLAQKHGCWCRLDVEAGPEEQAVWGYSWSTFEFQGPLASVRALVVEYCGDDDQSMYEVLS